MCVCVVTAAAAATTVVVVVDVFLFQGCPEGWNDDNRDEELSQYRSLARVFLMHQLEESQQVQIS